MGSPLPLDAMEAMGLGTLFGGNSNLKNKLQDLVFCIRKINWRLVFPDLSTRPRRNEVSAPVYLTDDLSFLTRCGGHLRYLVVW
eukprot:IDg7934t1